MAYPQYYPQYQQPQFINQQPQIQQPQQISTGFVSVRNELEAMNYPIAQGNSITFKDENAPYIYTKTMGFSQLDRPVFEKYKLVREPLEAEISRENNSADKNTIDGIKDEIKAIWAEINVLKEAPKKKKKEVTEDE